MCCCPGRTRASLPRRSTTGSPTRRSAASHLPPDESGALKDEHGRAGWRGLVANWLRGMIRKRWGML
jgi:hypothetical protein